MRERGIEGDGESNEDRIHFCGVNKERKRKKSGTSLTSSISPLMQVGVHKIL